MQAEAIHSIQYLVSIDYKHVVTDHKITLLTHIIDAVFNLNDIERGKIRNEVISKYRLEKPDRYLVKTYYISKNCLFNYHRKYNLGILNLLKVNQLKFISIVADTRNWNTHYLGQNKPARLKDGQQILQYFHICFVMLRIAIMNNIGVKPSDDMVKEVYFIIHDWIMDCNAPNCKNYKSNSRIVEHKMMLAFERSIEKQNEDEQTNN